MKPRAFFRPRLESLEDRWCPAINIDTLSIPGDLIITSIAGAQTDDLLVEQTSAGDFDIIENGGPATSVSGIFGNITIDLTTFPGSLDPTGIVLEFHLATQDDFTGDLTIKVPNATSGHLVRIGASAGGAIIGDFDNPGNVVVTSGTGSDSLFIGSAPGGAFGPININGSVIVNLGAGNDLATTRGSSVFNHVTMTNVNSTQIGLTQSTLIEGNLVWNNVGDKTNVPGSFTLEDNSQVRGHVTISTNTRNDTVLFDNGSDVQGNATLSLGHGVNSFTLDPDAMIRGDLSYIGGNQRDLVNLAGDSLVLGDAAFNLKSSGRFFGLQNELHLNGTILGDDITIIGGNGRDDVEFDTDAIGARVVATLGSGNDNFTLGAAAVFATADVDGGFGADVFINLLGPIPHPFALRRFP